MRSSVAAAGQCNIIVAAMVRPSTILLALSLLFLPRVVLADWSPEKSKQVDALVQRYLVPRPGRVTPPALSISIGENGQMVMAKGFGQARAGAPVSGETVYHIGSLTKQFTAAAMLRVIESGVRAPLTGKRLTLDTSLQDVFHDVERWTTADEPLITVRSLLNMTSNLPNFTKHPPPEADPWGAVEAPKLFAALKRQSPHGWPNTFEYSNTGYFLLARIIEAALANEQPPLSTRDYIRREFLLPTGMVHTGFVGGYAPGSELAEPHYQRRPAFAQPHWLDGCGDMASNVVDIFRWNKALMEGRVLAAQSRDAMFADAARVDPETYYGMGWFVSHEDGWDSYHHSGSVPGFTSYNAIQKRRDGNAWMSVTLLTNSDGVEDLDQLADDILYVVRGSH